MLSIPCALVRAARFGGLASALVLAAPIVGLPILATQANAQAAAGCGDIQKMLLDRKSIASTLTPKKGQQMDARFACAGFGKLVSNGQTLIKWVDANKDWCQIPDSFSDGIKADHTRAVAIRTKACGIAAKVTEMEKKAKEGGGQNGGLLGGGGLEGVQRMPQGAL
jgi:hypothetical protein